MLSSSRASPSLTAYGESDTGDNAAINALSLSISSSTSRPAPASTTSTSTGCKAPDSTLAVSSRLKNSAVMDESPTKDSTSNLKDVPTLSALSTSTVTRARDELSQSSSYERYRPPVLCDQAPVRAHQESSSQAQEPSADKQDQNRPAPESKVDDTSALDIPTYSRPESRRTYEGLTSNVRGTSSIKTMSPSIASSSTPLHRSASTIREHDGVKKHSTPTLLDVLPSSRSPVSSKTRKPGMSSSTGTSKSVHQL
ncbi:uncharacterized protein B0H18DRAFT_479438 [Fomitopsis serialis]|uniref:uncharacterized protein n=1 Tax=Fomitopsis serialis TaxID=139415 RepID=UPI002008B1CB|nr:uncharacterized protein B0H18DRAFT_479438 [Neoantrodia serialis]KAH9923067.1 hypothetical protein B0H18DRAFT_479438 [Neoantrodia serialis]